MLKQVTLSLERANEIQQVAARHGAEIAVVDCKDFNNRGLTVMLDISGSTQTIAPIVDELRRVEYVKKVYPAQDGPNCFCVAILERPSYCQAALDSGVLCLSCPLNTRGAPLRWEVVVRNSDALRSLIRRIEGKGGAVKVEEVSQVTRDETLTGRQREVLSKAISLGYFEFPRRIDLTSLSRLLNIKPSTLSEILRSAERKVMLMYGEHLKISKIAPVAGLTFFGPKLGLAPQNS